MQNPLLVIQLSAWIFTDCVISKSKTIEVKEASHQFIVINNADVVCQTMQHICER